MAKRKTGNTDKKNAELPRVHKELEGFDIRINSFGEITTTFDMDRINDFLNRNVDDKKLRDREDIPGLKDGAEKEDEESLFGEENDMEEDEGPEQ